MQSLTAFIATLPTWFLPVGWFALLIGWVLGQPATTRFFNKVTVIGFNNTTTNIARQAASSKAAGGDSPLSKVGSWASVVGLVLTLLPMLKDWLK